MLHLAIINGPNLNLLGTREPEIYGSLSFDSYLQQLKQRFPNISFSYYQSNIEGELINHLHNCRNNTQGVVINAGAYTHTSIALADAISSIQLPVIEVHISNILAREDYRKTSFIASKCVGSISGLGIDGYALAIQYFIDTLPTKTS
ncbi:MAG TPA: type II 3-dehydroquinate dehydratase [Flavipsychrobacter sp.]|nr:type II 3-dehydroquinate dehydratase [Flavipsychrobacter sp.]